MLKVGDNMKAVFICLPHAGYIEHNTKKIEEYCDLAYACNRVPVAKHLHNSEVLDENLTEEHRVGIEQGLKLLKRCDELWCFGNILTEGMRAELSYAIKSDITIRYFTDHCEEVLEKVVDIGTLIEEKDVIKALSDALDELLPQQKELVQKVFFEGMAIVEIARAEGVSEAVIRNRLNKIYKKLKNILNQCRRL